MRRREPFDASIFKTLLGCTANIVANLGMPPRSLSLAVDPEFEKWADDSVLSPVLLGNHHLMARATRVACDV